MSWDIVLFNSSNKIGDLEQFDADKLDPINFVDIFEKHFTTIKKMVIIEKLLALTSLLTILQTTNQ